MMKLDTVAVVTCSEHALLQWALGCYRAPRALRILNINVLVFPVTFTGALAFRSLLCTLVFFPFMSIVTEPLRLKLYALHSIPFFNLF